MFAKGNASHYSDDHLEDRVERPSDDDLDLTLRIVERRAGTDLSLSLSVSDDLQTHTQTILQHLGN